MLGTGTAHVSSLEGASDPVVDVAFVHFRSVPVLYRTPLHLTPRCGVALRLRGCVHASNTAGLLLLAEATRTGQDGIWNHCRLASLAPQTMNID